MTRNAGLGLGLYIAKQIAHAHGGRIDVESSVGRTVFRISVPRDLGEGGVSDARVPPS